MKNKKTAKIAITPLLFSKQYLATLPLDQGQVHLKEALAQLRNQAAIVNTAILPFQIENNGYPTFTKQNPKLKA